MKGNNMLWTNCIMNVIRKCNEVLIQIGCRSRHARLFLTITPYVCMAGASNVRYELSGRFNNVQGVMKEDYRRRYNLGFKLEYHVQNKLTMANRTTYSEVNYKQSLTVLSPST